MKKNNRYMVRRGKDGFELNNNDESEYVYITQYGEVYHIEDV